MNMIASFGDIYETIDGEAFAVYGTFPDKGEVVLGSMGSYPATLRIKAEAMGEHFAPFVSVLLPQGDWEPLAR